VKSRLVREAVEALVEREVRGGWPALAAANLAWRRLRGSDRPAASSLSLGLSGSSVCARATRRSLTGLQRRPEPPPDVRSSGRTPDARPDRALTDRARMTRRR
jgi:hypothetical protein